jgi:hypothetical protein
MHATGIKWSKVNWNPQTDRRHPSPRSGERLSQRTVAPHEGPQDARDKKDGSEDVFGPGRE